MNLIQTIKTNFWKYVSFILFLSTCYLLVAWRIENYGRIMDAQVYSLKAQIASQSNAMASSTPETSKVPVNLK